MSDAGENGLLNRLAGGADLRRLVADVGSDQEHFECGFTQHTRLRPAGVLTGFSFLALAGS
jgi:hypothetical protein